MCVQIFFANLSTKNDVALNPDKINPIFSLCVLFQYVDWCVVMVKRHLSTTFKTSFRSNQKSKNVHFSCKKVFVYNFLLCVESNTFLFVSTSYFLFERFYINHGRLITALITE